MENARPSSRNSSPSQQPTTSASLDSPIFVGPLRPTVWRLIVTVDDPSDVPTVGGFVYQDLSYPSFLDGRALPVRLRVVTFLKKVEEEDRVVLVGKGKKRMEFLSLKEEMKRMKEREVTVPLLATNAFYGRGG